MLTLQSNPDLVNTGTPMMEQDQEKKRMGKPFPYLRPGHKADNAPVPNFHGMPVRVCSRAAIGRRWWTSNACAALVQAVGGGAQFLEMRQLPLLTWWMAQRMGRVTNGVGGSRHQMDGI